MKNKELIQLILEECKINYSKLTIIKITFKSFLFINKWANDQHIKLSFSFKLKLSSFCGVIFQEYYNENLMNIFFVGISIQRAWDDLYDDKSTSNDFLKSLLNDFKKNASKNPIVISMIKLNQQLKIKAENKLLTKIYDSFMDEFSKLFIAYQYERDLSMKENLERIDLENYRYNSTISVALKYSMLLIGLSLIKDENELEQFSVIENYFDNASWAIRLSNDISGHKREINEGKLDFLTLSQRVDQKSLNESINKALSEILSQLKALKALNDNKFNVILKRITYLAVKRYLTNSF